MLWRKMALTLKPHVLVLSPSSSFFGGINATGVGLRFFIVHKQ